MIQRLALALAIATPIGLLDVGSVRADTPPSASSTNATYTIKSGDGLAAIARKLGVKLADLLAVNNITITSTIHPGQTLTVPSSTNSPAANSTASGGSGSGAAASTPTNSATVSSYTVKAGDSLFGIARKHSVSLSALLAANSFTTTSTILPGQVIKVPAAQSATQPAAQPAAQSAASPGPSTPAVTTTQIDTLVNYLREQVGKPYKFFTAGPDTFDCSGLVVAGYRQIGKSLPHQSRMQSTIGTEVDFRNEPIMAGDLIFMVSSVDLTQIGHVGIALDSSTWIQAVATGIPVSIKPIPNQSRISAVRRIINV